MTRYDTPHSKLPAGTVTLLFVDVEGSTRLLHALGERYAAVRGRLRELVRENARRWDGHEIDWAGDGAFLAFSGARDAVAAAADIQRAIAAESWPTDGVLRVRIGVHTGEPDRVDGGYVGLDVHVAARVCSAGHGDQIVVSQATRDVAGDEPAPGLSFRPLGRHRLKDVPEPQALFQLVGSGLVAEFPPLRTLAGATLPALHHRLVGRAVDLANIQQLLTRPEVRLVTITGPGGAGKSRLALEVAGEAAVHRPVHLVGLAPISDAELVPAAIARAIGVRESPGRTLLESVGETLAQTNALVLLDNLEHLPGAVEHVRRLLDLVPDVKLLVTSRVPLRLAAERVLPLAPLDVGDASILFAELAAARGIVLRGDTLGSVEAICRRLDGLPLAIELVAARLVLLPPSRILQALDDGLGLAMEGPIDLPDRQRSLGATLEWSYGLLNERQRELHGTLAVFAGGCMLEDARALAGGASTLLGDLEALVAWSLLRSDVADGDVRLSMLETVREHALARLEEAGTLEELRRLHAERFLGLAVTAKGELAGPDQRAWLGRLESDLDNIRAALDWLLAAGRVEDVLRAASALERFWLARAHVGEARRWLSIAQELATDVPADVRAHALGTAAHLAGAQSDWEAAAPLLAEAAALLDKAGLKADEATRLAYASFVALRRDDAHEAERLGRRALDIAAELEDPEASSFALMSLGDVNWFRGEHDEALARYEEAVELRRSLGDPLLVTDAIYNLGMAAYQGGDHARGRQAFKEALVLARELDEVPHVAAAQFMLAELDMLAGDAAPAAERAEESLGLYTSLGDDRSSARCLVILAGAAAAQGSYEQSMRLVGAAEALRRDGSPDAFELPILELCTSLVAGELGEDRVVELKTEGGRLGPSASVREVVTSVTTE